MLVESLGFLALAAVALGLLAREMVRTSPRAHRATPPRLLLLAAPFALWYVSMIRREPDSPIPALALVGLSAFVVAALGSLERRLRVAHRFRFIPTGIRAFEETGVSGRCMDSALTRAVRAHRSLRVTITRDELWIRPRIPLLSLATPVGLVHRVPLRRIHQMERLAGAGNNIRLEYEGDDGWCRCVELRLRNPAVFVEAIREGQLEALG